MKLIEATWDERNLGISVQELICPAGVKAESLKSQLLSVDANLIVVRLSEPSVEVSTLLMEKGFIYRESMITFHRTISKSDFESYSRLKLEVSEASNEQIEFIFDQIRSGMFATDRISSDPFFGIEIGAKRYINWIHDEISLGATIKFLSYRSKPVAFFLRRVTSNKQVYFALSGVFPACKIPGAGLVVQQEIVKEAAISQMTEFTTSVSTNNLGAMRVHIAAGFQISAVEYVFSRRTT